MRCHFEKFGELSDIAIMIDKRTGQSRGFGFITMKDPAAADIVVSTEHTIDGRVVDVKRVVPRDMAPAPTRAESKKIFVGGLPTEVTEKEFADYFSTFGLVKDVVVMVDRATNRSRGFGFVTFETEEAVDAVLRNKCEIMGKWVEVKRDKRGMSEPHILPQSKQWILQQLQSGHSVDPGLLSFTFFSYCCSPIYFIFCVSQANMIGLRFHTFYPPFLPSLFFRQLVSPWKIGHGFIFISSKLEEVLLPLRCNNKCKTQHQAQRNHYLRRSRNISKVFLSLFLT